MLTLLLALATANAADVRATWYGAEPTVETIAGDTAVLEWKLRKKDLPAHAPKGTPRWVRMTVERRDGPPPTWAEAPFHYAVLVERLRGGKPVEVLMAPTLAALPGQTAEVYVGRQVGGQDLSILSVTIAED